VVGVVAAWIQLGEQPDALEAVGIGLIAAALAILTARGIWISRGPKPLDAPVGAAVETQRAGTSD
jgi:drug/metabolite transporter (DMT)-like permease